MSDAQHARQLHQRGDLPSAMAAYQRALQQAPDDAVLLHDAAIALLQGRRADEAVLLLKRAVAIAPAQFDSLLALAHATRASGQASAGVAAAVSATQQRPQEPAAWMIRGSLEAITGAFAQAEASLRRALALEPTMAEAWHYLGESLQAQHRWADAAHAYRQALPAQPGEIMNIALCAELAGDWQAARAGYEQMCALHPRRSDCLARLAQVQAMLCNMREEAAAVQRLEQLLAHPQSLAPDDCMEPFPLSFLPLSDAARRTVLARQRQRVLARSGAVATAASTRPTPAANTPVRIGYISADFGQHAVGTLLRGLFAAHDRGRYRVHGYSLRQHDDDTARALLGEFDQVHHIEAWPSDSIAQAIRDDGIDVLIDLGGFTRGARPDVLAQRPAPLQLGWLGFIHGHDAPWLDGIVLDAVVQPEDAPWPYTDTVLRLHGCVLPSGPLPRGTPDRQRFGLPADVPLLASFNNSYKLDAELIAAWVEILRRVTDAQLVIYLPEQARAGFLREWQRAGGDSARVIPVGHLPAQAQADRAASCDLFLDAFRYQAGATAMACVAAGLPILCRVGDTALARLGVSINRMLGLDALICNGTAHYIEQAVALAREPQQLHDIRATMQAAAVRMGLHDPRRAAAAIEQLIDRLMDEGAHQRREAGHG